MYFTDSKKRSWQRETMWHSKLFGNSAKFMFIQGSVMVHTTVLEILELLTTAGKKIQAVWNPPAPACVQSVKECMPMLTILFLVSQRSSNSPPMLDIRLLLTEYLLILGYDATISRALAIRWVFRAMWQLYYELKFWPCDNKNASRQYLLKSVFRRQCSRKVSKMGTHHNPVFRVDDVDRALGSLLITVKHQVSSHSINEVHFNKTCNNQSCFNGKEQLQQGNCDAPLVGQSEYTPPCQIRPVPCRVVLPTTGCYVQTLSHT